MSTRIASPLPSTTLALLLPFVLSGCIASYSVKHGEPLGTAPDFAVVCRYNWKADDPLFRSDNLTSYRWGSARNFNHRVDDTVRTLAGPCPQASAEDRIDATISTHYLRYANKAARGALVLPAAFATGFTLGFVPLPMTDYFAVCLDLTAGDGLRRRAVVTAELDRITNTWGATNHRYRQGMDEARQKPDEVMREMTVHAWRKAWATENRATPMPGCAETLDAIVNGTAPE